MSKTKYLIWSVEHNSWWKAHRCGYTPDKKEAGRYEFNEATEIILDANKYCDPDY